MSDHIAHITKIREYSLTIASHLDITGTYARILFIDISSVFSTTQSHLLLQTSHRNQVSESTSSLNGGEEVKEGHLGSHNTQHYKRGSTRGSCSLYCSLSKSEV